MTDFSVQKAYDFKKKKSSSIQIQLNHIIMLLKQKLKFEFTSWLPQPNYYPFHLNHSNTILATSK